LGALHLDSVATVAALRRALADPRPFVRDSAGDSLRKLQGNAEPDGPGVRNVLAPDVNPGALAIPPSINWPGSRTGMPDPDGVVQVLITEFEGQGTPARAAFATALGGFGPRARAAVPSLLKALHDPAPEVRAAATNALLKIAPEALDNTGEEQNRTEK